MKQRRRLIAAKSRPVTATIMAVALLASAAVGITATNILKTKEDGIKPIDPTMTTASLADGKNVVVNDPAISKQGDGNTNRTVKEFKRDEAFSQFGLTWDGKKDIAAFVRGQRADGTWTPWFDTDPLDYGSSKPFERKGTDLIYIEPTNTVQVSIAGVDLLKDKTAKDLNAVFIDGGKSTPTDSGIKLAADSDGLPKVISRAEWGADESLRCEEPEYTDHTSAIVIHHTAGSNNYSEDEAAGIVRGIYKYHAQQLGWCDIGYHSLADKFGNLYEGHYGGMNKSVIGAHTGGFNENTWAISMLGNYQEEEPTDVMIKSVGELAGWRAKVAGIDPLGKGTHTSEGTEFTFYPYGTKVELPNIFAHRDVGNTECPGDYAYAKMDQIRQIAKAKFDSLGGKSIDQDITGDNNGASNNSNNSGGSNAGTGTNNRGVSNNNQKSADNAASLVQGLQRQGKSDNKSDTNNSNSLVGLILKVLSANGGLIGTLSKLGTIKIINGLDLGKIISLAQKLAPLSSNNQIFRTANTNYPSLGEARTKGVTYTNGYDQEVTYTLFENGIVVGTPTTGTHALWGPIGDTWAAQGFDMGPLGLPVSEEEANGELVRVDFEGGYATYDSATGKVDVKTNEKGDARNNAVQAGTTAGDSDIAAAASSANSTTSATPAAAATTTGSKAAGEEAAAHATTGATGAAAGNAEPIDADIPVTTEE